MKNYPRLTSLCFFFGTLLLCTGVVLSFCFRGSTPLTTKPSPAALAVTEDFLDAVRAGDLESAGAMLLDQPRLTFEPAEESPLANVLWPAYTGSIRAEFRSSLTPSDTGCRREVAVTVLNIPALMAQLKEEAPALLAAEALAIGEDLAFGEDNHYRLEFATEVLQRSLEEMLARPEFLTTSQLTLDLELQDGVWRILPSQKLLDLLCGKIP